MKAVIMALCGILSLLLIPRAANASAGVDFFGGASAINALSPRALGTGAEAAYFNPALLPSIAPTFSLNILWVAEESNIQLMPRPDGVDISSAIYQATVDGKTPTHHPLPTSQLLTRPSTQGTSIFEPSLDLGLVTRLLGDRLVFGFFARLPAAQFQSTETFFPDEREQYFSNTLYPTLRGDRLGLTSLFLAFGGKVSEWLSLGVGMSLSLSTVARTKIFLPDATDQERVVVNTDLKVKARVAPNVSLRVDALDGWSFSMGLKASTGQDVENHNQVIFWSTEEPKSQEFTFSTGYQPMNLFLAAELTAWECGNDQLKIGGEAVWENWASYRNRHGEAPLLKWKNTINLSIGARYRTGKLRFSADGRYQGSPVPDQTGRENYVDNDRVGLATGIEAELNVWGVKLYGGIHFQGHFLLSHEVLKDANSPTAVIDEFPDASKDIFTDEPIPEAAGLQTNNPGYPGFSSDGFLFVAGVTLRTPL